MVNLLKKMLFKKILVTYFGESEELEGEGAAFHTVMSHGY
jgi:hypothetical protein